METRDLYGQQPDGCRPDDQNALGQTEPQPAYCRDGVRKVLQQRALLHVHVVRQREEASLGGRGVLRQAPVQREAEGLEAFAFVGAARAAGRAHPAQHVGMDGNAVSGLGVLDAGPALLDHAGELVPRYEREPHLGQDAAADAKVVVAEAGALHPEHHLVLRGPGPGAVGKPVLTRSRGVQGLHQEPLRAAGSWRGSIVALTRGLAAPATAPTVPKVSKCRFRPSPIAMQFSHASAGSLQESPFKRAILYLAKVKEVSSAKGAV